MYHLRQMLGKWVLGIDFQVFPLTVNLIVDSDQKHLSQEGLFWKFHYSGSPIAPQKIYLI